jgi:hypothetical protein
MSPLAQAFEIQKDRKHAKKRRGIDSECPTKNFSCVSAAQIVKNKPKEERELDADFDSYETQSSGKKVTSPTLTENVERRMFRAHLESLIMYESWKRSCFILRKRLSAQS